MKRTLSLLLALVMVLSLAACSSGNDGRVSPPFSVEDRLNYTIEEAVSLFEGAGFSDVSAEPTIVFSASDKLGKVNMISVDGDYTFSSSRRYSSDAPVVITYYELKETDPTPEPTTEPTSDPDTELWTDPEMVRDFAQSLDFSIRDLCSLSEASYDDFLAILSDDSTSSLDRYDAANELQSSLSSYLLQLMDKECPEVPSFTEYQDCAEYYISYMMGVADSTITYLDDPTTSNLAAIQSDMEAVPQYAQYTVAARSVFLTDAGFSQEEIAAMPSEAE